MERSEADASTHNFGKILVKFALAGAAVGVLLPLPFSVFLSQYYPVFGNFEKLGQPWSPARESLISVHLFAFGLVGATLGAVLGASAGYLNAGKFSLKSTNAGGVALRPSRPVSALKRPSFFGRQWPILLAALCLATPVFAYGIAMSYRLSRIQDGASNGYGGFGEAVPSRGSDFLCFVAVTLEVLEWSLVIASWCVWSRGSTASRIMTAVATGFCVCSFLPWFFE